MSTLSQDANCLWTTDLTVGCSALDLRNAHMLDLLAGTASVISASEGAELAEWLDACYDQFEVLLSEEERELATVGYPELSLHQRLHGYARSIIHDARRQLQRAPTSPALAALASQSCAALALWLPRHIVEADRMFLPYVDSRFRGG